MTALETLYQRAYDDDVYILNSHFSPTKKAACICGVNDNIVLDLERIASCAEETELLAHELTHIENGNVYFIMATSNSPIERSNRLKYETKTDRETILQLLPPDTLQRAIDSVGTDYWCIAEYCDHTIEFVKKAFGIYDIMGIQFEIPDGQVC